MDTVQLTRQCLSTQCSYVHSHSLMLTRVFTVGGQSEELFLCAHSKDLPLAPVHSRCLVNVLPIILSVLHLVLCVFVDIQMLGHSSNPNCSNIIMMRS